MKDLYEGDVKAFFGRKAIHILQNLPDRYRAESPRTTAYVNHYLEGRSKGEINAIMNRLLTQCASLCHHLRRATQRAGAHDPVRSILYDETKLRLFLEDLEKSRVAFEAATCSDSRMVDVPWFKVGTGLWKTDKDEFGHTAFELALLNGCTDVVGRFLAAGVDPNGHMSGSNESFLFRAAANNDGLSVKHLLKYGADPSLPSTWSPKLYAADAIKHGRALRKGDDGAWRAVLVEGKAEGERRLAEIQAREGQPVRSIRTGAPRGEQTRDTHHKTARGLSDTGDAHRHHDRADARRLSESGGAHHQSPAGPRPHHDHDHHGSPRAHHEHPHQRAQQHFPHHAKVVITKDTGPEESPALVREDSKKDAKAPSRAQLATRPQAGAHGRGGRGGDGSPRRSGDSPGHPRGRRRSDAGPGPATSGQREEQAPPQDVPWWAALLQFLPPIPGAGGGSCGDAARDSPPGRPRPDAGAGGPQPGVHSRGDHPWPPPQRPR